ncbi:MAG TPA: copper chaperone PCu(A)C [Acidimicrobiia bacterium]|nr:copper chaperone PCu(A)C [Acidimicrobiia bacterium]
MRLPPADTTALYMDITNKGDAAFVVTSATSDFASTYELHESKMADGQMVMEKVPSQEIPIAAGETVRLEPGGLHVMAIGIEHARLWRIRCAGCPAGNAHRRLSVS